jgi:hypothetical protein
MLPLGFEGIYHRADRAAKRKPPRLQMIRPAGFLRLDPVVPDRATFGAAIEQKPNADQANDCRNTPHHGRPTHYPGQYYGFHAGLFKHGPFQQGVI